MEANQPVTQRRRIRWLWVVAVIAMVCVAVGVRWLAKPLPPPVVSLKFVGFVTDATNVWAELAMTNLGSTTAYYSGRDWRAEFETQNGVLTNYPYFRRYGPYPFQQGEGCQFPVDIPDGVIRWRVISSYEWFERRKLRVEAMEWLDDHLDEGRLQNVAETVLGPVLGQRPEKFDLYDFTATPWLTNLPPPTIPFE